MNERMKKSKETRGKAVKSSEMLPENAALQNPTKVKGPRRRSMNSKAKVADALMLAHGVAGVAAVKLGVSRQTVYDYMKRWPDLLRVREDARETVTDRAELNIVKAIGGGDIKSSRWWLQHQARDRGFGERLEVQHEGTVHVTLDLGNGIVKEA